MSQIMHILSTIASLSENHFKKHASYFLIIIVSHSLDGVQRGKTAL